MKHVCTFLFIKMITFASKSEDRYTFVLIIIFCNNSIYDNDRYKKCCSAKY